MKKKYLLRAEGVNLSSVLDDTSEISVRRGAGLMLRQAILDIENQYEKNKTFKSISVGASAGLFSFKSDEPEKILGATVEFLNKKYKHFTFVVDYIENTGEFNQDKEKLLAKNRIRQFKQMTFVAPTLGESAAGVCEMDLLRPYTSNPVKKGGKIHRVSDASALRFNYGRDSRQKFYSRETGKKIDDDFTSDLGQLSQPDSAYDYGNLNGKIALIYLDGNKFGNIQKKCTTEKSLTDFDNVVQHSRKTFLESLLGRVAEDADFRNFDQARLETLLWGGDEVMLVVPAWKGLETLEHFYQSSQDWRYESTDLTHAGGVVFASHKTPISQLISAAYRLADNAKINVPVENNITHKNGNLFDYLVLESVDYPTQGIADFWDIRYGASANKIRKKHSLSPSFFTLNQDTYRERLSAISKGVVMEIAKSWCEHQNAIPNREDGKETLVDSPQFEKFQKKLKRFKQISSEDYDYLVKKVLPKILGTEEEANPDTVAWLHLTELWDYIVLEGCGKKGGA